MIAVLSNVLQQNDQNKQRHWQSKKKRTWSNSGEDVTLIVLNHYSLFFPNPLL